MGLFMEAAVIPDSTEEEVRAALSALESRNGQNGMQLETAACQIAGQNGGVSVLFNEYCAGYAPLAQALSAQLKGLALFLFIYDDDFWGYYCCENGELLDEFNPMPDYFEEVSEAERQRVSGSSALLAERFHVPEADLAGYLVPWDAGVLLGPERRKAYETDTYGIGDCWQMADFMDKLGYPYMWQ